MIAGRVVLDKEGLQQLFDMLRKRGYSLVGPTLREGAIVYDQIAAVRDLPVGWIDEQEGGTYRLKKTDDESVFGYAVGPMSWKRFLFPPTARLWQANRGSKNMDLSAEEKQAQRYAFIGVRSCEIHAIATQDKVFLKGEHSDPGYKARRQNAFVVAVNCSHASGNCFCTSMQTGPKVTFGYDLAFTEVLGNGSHFFVVDVGSEHGGSVMESISHKAASQAESNAADEVSEAVEMHKVLDTAGIKELLDRNYENPRWAEVTHRCLTCGNCTVVCPTCFCTTNAGRNGIHALPLTSHTFTAVVFARHRYPATANG
jgi:ferredoxin